MKTKFLPLLVIFAFLAACATGPKVIPAGCENSLIYKYSKLGPETDNALITLGVYELVKQYPKLKPQVIIALNAIDLAVTADTYAELMAYIISTSTDLQKQYGTEILIMMPVVGQLSTFNIPIDACDQTIIKKNTASIRTYVNRL
jgi:hypothetical protein